MKHKDEIEALLHTLPGEIGFSYLCPATGDQYAMQADLPLVAASVIKLPIMVEAFRQRESGHINWMEEVTIHSEDKLPSCGALTYLHDGLRVTVGDLVTLMIILSDNTATNLLIDKLGMENINATCKALQLKGTKLNRKLFDAEQAARGIENYVTAGDMCRLLSMLLCGQVVSPDASREMLKILGNQRLNGKIPFYLHSRGIPVAHKTGEDDGITHDVGMIFTAEPQIMCFLSNHTDVPAAERCMQDIANLLTNV